MAQNFATGTIDANDETVGPISIPNGKNGFVAVDYTAGTLTLQATPDGTNWINVEDGYTADTYKLIEGPGQFRVIGSSTPNAVVTLSAP
ncbi:MAG: hypothetical protein AAGL17_06275 [Cyanobacteria bacterium J06576_12]